MWTIICLILVVVVVATLRKYRQQDIANLAAAELQLDDRQGALFQAKTNLRLREQEWSLAFDSFNAIDIETTGLSRAKSRIIQIAVVSFVAGDASYTWSTYLNPGIPIPENATKVNNITNEMVASAPSFAHIMSDLERRLNSNPLVSHNLKYDTDILMAEFSKQGVSWFPLYGYCTMRMARGAPITDSPREERTFYSKIKRGNVTYTVKDRALWLKLGALMTQHGVRPIGNLHDARTDATGCGEVFIAQAMAAILAANNAVVKATEAKTTAEISLNNALKRRQRWRT